MNKEDFYAIVFKSGQFEIRKNTDEFKLIPDQAIECFLFARYDNTFKGPSNTTNWFQFYFVDKSGNPTTYRVGDFEISYLGVDTGCTNFFGRRVTIHNIVSDNYYEFKSTCPYRRFIPDEIKPLLEKLNGCANEDEMAGILKSHVPYQDLQYRYNDLQRSYDNLKEEAEKLKSDISKLESTLSKIKTILE